MEWFEPLIIVAAILFVGIIFFLHFYRRFKKGHHSCGCGCGCSKEKKNHCPMCEINKNK